jgi:nitrilase
MPQKLKLAVSQSRTLATLAETLEDLAATTRLAASQGVDLILFPEAYLGGYPRTCDFGATVGSRTDAGREQFRRYFQGCPDLGDTPAGAGEAWVGRKLPVAAGREFRGDGTREALERVARETGVFVVAGVVERCGGSLYCAVVYVCPREGVVGKRRKVMPTGAERLVWAQGAASTLRAVTTTLRGVRVTLAAAICWENMMPLLRQSLYCQNVNLWLAPTADARDTWLPLMQTVGNEGRCFVLSSISCVKRKNLPGWITGLRGPVPMNVVVGDGPSSVGRGRRRSTITVREEKHELVLPALQEDPGPSSVTDEAVVEASSSSATGDGSFDPTGEEYVCRGGSCIISPMGAVLQGPLWEVEDGGLVIHEADFDDCERGRLDLDLAGSYARNDAFKLTVEGLDLSPPP